MCAATQMTSDTGHPWEEKRGMGNMSVEEDRSWRMYKHRYCYTNPQRSWIMYSISQFCVCRTELYIRGGACISPTSMYVAQSSETCVYAWALCIPWPVVFKFSGKRVLRPVCTCVCVYLWCACDAPRCEDWFSLYLTRDWLIKEGPATWGVPSIRW